MAPAPAELFEFPDVAAKVSRAGPRVSVAAIWPSLTNSARAGPATAQFGAPQRRKKTREQNVETDDGGSIVGWRSILGGLRHRGLREQARGGGARSGDGPRPAPVAA